MNAKVGSSHNRKSGIFLTARSGSSVPSRPRADPPSRANTVQPYQYIAGPSPLRPAAHQRSTRLVAGWKVNNGQFICSASRYSKGKVTPNTMANVFTLVADAQETVDDALEDTAEDAGALVTLVTDVVVLVVMIRTPAHC